MTMNKKNMSDFTINFRLYRQRAKQGKCNIYLRLTLDNRRVEIASHLQIEEKFWDQKKQFVKESNPESGLINGKLNIIRADVQRHYNRLIALGQTMSVDKLKNEYLGITERQKSFNELMEFHYSRFKEKVAAGKKSKSSLKCIYTTKEKVKAFVRWQYKFPILA